MTASTRSVRLTIAAPPTASEPDVALEDSCSFHRSLPTLQPNHHCPECIFTSAFLTTHTHTLTHMPSRAASALRRSARLKSSTPVISTASSLDRGRDDKNSAPPAKRRRVAADAEEKGTSLATVPHAAVRRKRRSLSMLPHMPLDIWYEVSTLRALLGGTTPS